jgi:hypothetical protein
MTQSSIDQRQDTSRFDERTHSKLEERSVPPSVFYRPNGEFNKHIENARSNSMVLILEKYPELRSTALKDFIYLQLSNKTDISFTQRLCMYFKRTPTLENDLRLKMRRYGVPYDPLRPTAYKIGYTFYIRDIVSWLANKLR